MAPAAVAVLQYSPVHHRFRVSAKKNLEISEIADAGKKSEIEISAALILELHKAPFEHEIDSAHYFGAGLS